MKKVLIAGASGINGYATANTLIENPNYEIITMSRSSLPYDLDCHHLEVDLLEKEDLEKHETELQKITHIFYAALKPNEDPRKEAEENKIMFKNCIEQVYKFSEHLQHVTFLQGGKVYGAHLGNYKTPAKEDQSRHFPPNLYFEQEDYIRSFCKKHQLTFTALRPDIVIGFSLESAMNMGNLIAVYASICKEKSMDFTYPGSQKGFEILANVCDSELVAEACLWTFENKNTHNQCFNITNGDCIRWKHLWDAVADYFQIPMGIAQPIQLSTYLPANEDLWKSMVEKYSLKTHKISDLAKGDFGDFIFNVENDAIFDVNKARRAGFAKMHRDSITSILKHFDVLKDKNIIPSF